MDILHKSSMTMEGHLVILPLNYFWKALENSKYGKKFYIDTTNLQPVGFIETAFRIFVFVAADITVSKYIPLAIWGTRNLEIVPDFCVKRVFAIMCLSFLS